MAPSPDRSVIAITYAYPASVFAYFAFSSLVATFTLQIRKEARKLSSQRPGRTVTLGIFGLFLIGHVAQLIVVAVGSFSHRSALPEDHLVVGPLSCVLVFGLQFTRLLHTDNHAWHTLYGSWTLALAFELALLFLGVFQPVTAVGTREELATVILTALRCLALVVLLAASLLGFWVGEIVSPQDEERQALLGCNNAAKSTFSNENCQDTQDGSYGSTSQNGAQAGDDIENIPERRERESREASEKRLQEVGGWFEYCKGFMVRPRPKSDPFYFLVNHPSI